VLFDPFATVATGRFCGVIFYDQAMRLGCGSWSNPPGSCLNIEDSSVMMVVMRSAPLGRVLRGGFRKGTARAVAAMPARLSPRHRFVCPRPDSVQLPPREFFAVEPSAICRTICALMTLSTPHSPNPIDLRRVGRASGLLVSGRLVR